MFGKLFKSFFSKSEEVIESVEYKGFSITPILENAGGRYNTQGKISKEIDGEVKEVTFIRADAHTSPEQAEEHSIIKAKQIIGEQGDNVFKQSRV